MLITDFNLMNVHRAEDGPVSESRQTKVIKKYVSLMSRLFLKYIYKRIMRKKKQTLRYCLKLCRNFASTSKFLNPRSK